eukprot:CAMPEP_0115066232 /NCGR_PEP_ID=MMETSP0227-20121206/10699_1 /TAXON_ID=89957 /ORGANISM="Polarella glacialis, Strain CCMP 1383" /LENGTH=58 /DNA_ID=CAMNT_0002452123 /DNA_START=1545 /DNA_END=1718 /DNA_ORIENTATION=+
MVHVQVCESLLEITKVLFDHLVPHILEQQTRGHRGHRTTQLGYGGPPSLAVTDGIEEH